ncbi:triose-phosphate isomerase [Thermoproteota archaeon]
MMKLKRPLILINFKTSMQGTGKNAVKLAKICERVAKKTKANMCVVVQSADIYRVSQTVSIPVFAGHVDPIDFGSHTGHELPQAVKEAGAVGTLINHSEHHLDIKQTKKTIAAARKSGLVGVVCARTASEAAKIAKFKPDFIAVEPPELIGGEISVSTARPQLISDTVKKVHSIAKVPVLTGAGVKDGKDVAKSLELGTEGVLVASGVVKSKDPEKALMDLASGL